MAVFWPKRRHHNANISANKTKFKKLARTIVLLPLGYQESVTARF